MKVRTVTAGATLNRGLDTGPVVAAADVARVAGKVLGDRGFEVQSLRIATNPFPEYMPGPDPGSESDADVARRLEEVCRDESITFLSLGPAATPGDIERIPAILTATSRVAASATVADATGVLPDNITAAARAVAAIAATTDRGYGNFRFCAAALCPPGIPFFPAAYHQGEPGSPTFSVGLECSDLLMQAAESSRSLAEAEERFLDLYTTAARTIEQACLLVEAGEGAVFLGIDTSLAPSLEPGESIAYAFEKLGPERFGNHATLAVAAMVTRVLKAVPVRQCGYRGLMLPVCEDAGLATRADEGTFGLTSLLAFSSVCGTGLDTVPVPGDTPIHKIEALFLDVATLAATLRKPLSARLLPVPGLGPGERTDFGSPYLIDCKTIPVE